MAVSIPLFDFIFIWFYLVSNVPNSKTEKVSSEHLAIDFIKASVLWCLSLWFFTEFLSAFHSLTFGGAVIAWSVIFVLLVVLLYRRRTRIAQIFIGFWQYRKIKLTVFEAVIIIFLIFLFASTLFLALYYPPNNWDSMTYHMSRVFYWIQNHSVNHYATHNERQIVYQPFAEYIILHLKLLSRSDFFDNTIQWFGYIGSVTGIYLITKQLVGARKAALSAAIIAAAVPLAILEAMTTQNDLVNSFFIILSVYFLLRYVKNHSKSDLLFLSVSIGLALLTKGTAYIFIAGFVIIYGIRELYRKKIRSSLIAAGIVIIVPLVINAGYYYRNFNTYRNPLDTAEEKQTNELFTPAALISSISKNAYLHLTTPYHRWNTIIQSLLLSLHSGLGLDVNDPRLNYLHTSIKSVPDTFTYQEDTTQNFFHLLLILSCIPVAIIIFIRHRHEERPLLIYMLCLILTCLLFCYLFKWQPWHTRLHLPLFLLFTPFCGILLAKSDKMLYPVLALLMFFALPCIFMSHSQPMPLNYAVKMNRYDKVFINNPRIKDSYIKTIDMVKRNHFKMIGLHLGGDDWDYPLCYFLKEKNHSKVFFAHVIVNNESNKYEKPDFNPDCIISMRSNNEVLYYHNTPFYLVLSTDPLKVYIRKK